jgi:acyl-CoA hydrolase
MPELKAKPVRESMVHMTEIVLPGDTNTHGTIFGGKVLALIDIAGGVCAMRHCRMPVVTASIDSVDFLSPIRLGYFVVLEARLNYVHKTSMEVGVEVEAENPTTGERQRTTAAYLTYVGLDGDGRPAPVPPLLLETPEEERRAEQAIVRRALRLGKKQLTPGFEGGKAAEKNK